MTIGTAKPSPEELQAIKHYFIDEFPVTQQVTAADFETLALQYLDKIFASHDTAVVCGGTGLYVKALCEGLDEMPETDPVIVKQLEHEYSTNGISWLQEAVNNEDPEFYAQGEIQNPARMLRALSFIRSTGKSIVHYRTQTRKQRPFRIVKVGLELPRAILYSRIDARVDVMMSAGLLAEAEALYPMKYLKTLQTVGYQELFDMKDGIYTYEEAVEKIKQHTRNYAKRQMTWFRKDAEINWLKADEKDTVQQIVTLGEQSIS